MFCLSASERTAIVGFCEEEFALAVSHRDGCVDEEVSPEPPLATGVSGSWVKNQFGVIVGSKEIEHF